MGAFPPLFRVLVGCLFLRKITPAGKWRHCNPPPSSRESDRSTESAELTGGVLSWQAPRTHSRHKAPHPALASHSPPMSLRTRRQPPAAGGTATPGASGRSTHGSDGGATPALPGECPAAQSCPLQPAVHRFSTVSLGGGEAFVLRSKSLQPF